MNNLDSIEKNELDSSSSELFDLEKLSYADLSNELIEIYSKLLNIYENVINSEKYDSIFTRYKKENFDFKVFDNRKLDEIVDNMNEIDNKINIFGRRDTQFNRLFLTLHHETPYRNMMQIMAEIENRRIALRDSIYSLRKKFLDLVEKMNEIMILCKNKDILNKIKISKLILEIEEAQASIVDSRIYIEGALKEILLLQKAYIEIKESFNIEDWDELDYEKHETEYHLRRAFYQSIRDVRQSNTISSGNQEYLELLGINPLSVLIDIRDFIPKAINDISMKTTDEFVDFLVQKYGNCISYGLRKRGLKRIYHEEPMYLRER